MAQQVQSEIRYLTPPSVDVKKKKYCRFKKSGIRYIDYKDPEFLKKFLNEQGKILPRRITQLDHPERNLRPGISITGKIRPDQRVYILRIIFRLLLFFRRAGCQSQQGDRQ